MQKLLIKGKKELNGTIPISGSKNATLPILAASILTNKVILTNVPMGKDIFTMLDLLKFIKEVTSLPLISSGGISSLSDIKEIFNNYIPEMAQQVKLNLSQLTKVD